MTDDRQAAKEQAYKRYEQGDLEGALKLLAGVYARYGADAELANDIAVVLHGLGRSEEALGKFREAHSLGGEKQGYLANNLLNILEQQLRDRGPQGAERKQAPAADRKVGARSVTEDFGATTLKQALEVWQNDSAAELYRKAAALSDEEWIRVLFDSVEDRLFDGHILPGFVSEETQRSFVGSAGITAMQEAANFIRVVLKYSREQGIAFDGKTRAADFGSGWGRYTRFMLKYVHPDNLYGLEVSPVMVEQCRRSFGTANFLKVDSYPPCDLRDALVDLIFGYSVFSHLAPDCAESWIDEFARILRPGGLALMTTQGRTFIEYCRNIRESGDRSNAWFKVLADSFVDAERAYKDYDAGIFLHANHGQYGGSYGESLIPRAYIERNWLRYFELVDFVDDRAFLPQALFVLKRKENRYGS